MGAHANLAPGSAAQRTAMTMLAVLCAGFALSQSYRTLAAILAAPLQTEMQLSPRQLGLYAAMFHFSFAACQFPMGIGIDLYGIRRTILWVAPLCVVGAVLSAMAPSFGWLLLGQVIIGIGCAPAFVVCTVLIARTFPPDRFAALSGGVMGVAGLGMLATGTPAAWLVAETSWRSPYFVLAVASALAWLAAWRTLTDDRPSTANGKPTVGQSVRGFLQLFALPHTAGIVVLGGLTYSCFMAMRGLWLGPQLLERESFSLVQVGNLALAVSLIALVAPPLFGRLDPGDRLRRRWILCGALLLSALFALLAVVRGPVLTIAVVLAIALCHGYAVLQYADVRAAYPSTMTGRAMSVFTMAMFLGVAVMQWLTGLVASLAVAWQVDTYLAVYGFVSVALLLGALAFRFLPQPPRH